MVPGIKPVIEDEKVPMPEPSFVLLSKTVGNELVLQHIPLAEIVNPPSLAMLPLATTSVFVILVTDNVFGAYNTAEEFAELIPGIINQLPLLKYIVSPLLAILSIPFAECIAYGTLNS